MKSIYIVVSLVLFSISPAIAGEIAVWYSCDIGQSPERLIKSLAKAKLILSRPYEAHDSIEYFQASADVTAFGFPLIAVEGAELGSKFFHRSHGIGPSSRTGLIVQGELGPVQRALKERGLTVIEWQGLRSGPAIYVGSFEYFLPKAANSRFAYTRIACYPG